MNVPSFLRNVQLKSNLFRSTDHYRCGERVRRPVSFWRRRVSATATATAVAAESPAVGRDVSEKNEASRFFFAAATSAVLTGAAAKSALDDNGQPTNPPRQFNFNFRFRPWAKVECEAVAAQSTASWPSSQSGTEPAKERQGGERSSVASSAKLMRPPKSSRPKNVMIHRMRSVRARDLNEKYDINWGKVLGEGAYGSVYPARLATTGEKVALKKISKRYTKASSFKTETDALLRIYDNGGHPNISGLRDMYEDYSHFYLILDLVSGGEMFDHLINYGAYSEADAARLMREVASALAFMHGVGVVHADLKPENLLLCSKHVSDGTIKIIDFGCSTVSNDNYHDDDDDDLYDDEMRPTKSPLTIHAASTGTTAYWPPERFTKNCQATSAMDMWSAGVILYIMLTGVHPFDLEGMSTDEEIEERIRTDPTPPVDTAYTDHLSPSAVDLIQRLMEKDPKKRIDAYEMMCHPWIRGETANTFKIVGSDKKLSRFKDLRHKLEAGIFAVLVSTSNQDESLSEAKWRKLQSDGNPHGKPGDNHIMKRAFEVFDAEGKGFVSSDDLGRVVSEVTGAKLSCSDKEDMLAATLDGKEDPSLGNAGLSLSVFTDLFSSLKHEHYQKGQMIFSVGEEGDAMYFITSGKVEVLTRKGQLVSLLRHGDFFGEGSLLEENNKRFTSARAGTPVDVIKISRRDYERYISSSEVAKQSLKLKWRARVLDNAKNLIRLQTNVKLRTLRKGEVVYNEGEESQSMFVVDEEEGGMLDALHGGVKVHSYHGGESFGESSLLFKRPRSSTVVCASDTCKIHEMHGEDFLEAIEASPRLANSLRDMCRKRLFKKAVKKFSRDRNRGFTPEDLEAAFNDADTDNSGTLDVDEIRHLFHSIDPSFPDSEILALMDFLDIDEDGHLSLEEFKRIFRVFDL